MNTYTSLHTLKSPSILNLTDDAHDDRLLMLAENVSRHIDRFCNRHFFCLKATRLFDGSGGDTLLVPDLISLDPAGLKTDDDLDGSFETTWPDSDYLLYPANADPAAGLDVSSPYNKLVVNTTSGLRESFPDGRRTVPLSGQWGYWTRLWTAEGSLEEALDTDETDAPLERRHRPVPRTHHTGRFGADVRPEDSRQHPNRDPRRQRNHPATHLFGDGVRVFAYPGPVTEAAILQVSRLWRNDPLDTGLHPNARHLLSSYRRLPTARAILN